MEAVSYFISIQFYIIESHYFVHTMYNMLSIALHDSRKNVNGSIDLPKKNYIKKVRSKTEKTSSNENLAELASFDPSNMASSPPGGTFLYNLRHRIENA